MRPSSLHLGILAALMIPGIALYLSEVLSPGGSGLFVRFAATKVYWFSFAVYAAASTAAVAAAYLVTRARGAALTGAGVLLSHLLLVGSVWLVVSLGIHDRIQDAWRRLATSKGQVAPPVPAATPGPLLSAAQHRRPPVARIQSAGTAESVEVLGVAGERAAEPKH